MSLVRIQSPRPTFANACRRAFATVGKPTRRLSSIAYGAKEDGKPHTMIAVPIRYRSASRAIFVQKLQHAVPSIVVLSDGLDHLSHAAGLDWWLGAVEVGVSLLVMGSVVRGVRELVKHTAKSEHDVHIHHGIDWVDICLAAMLSVEAYAKYHATLHIPRPTILLAVTMLTVGLTHGRLAKFGDRRRQLRVSADGISVPGRQFRRMTLTWAEVGSIDIDDRWAVVTATNGREQRINLRDVLRPNAVRDALASARALLAESRHAASASIESSAVDA